MPYGPRIAQQRTDPHKTLGPTTDVNNQKLLRTQIHAARADIGKSIIHIPAGTVLTPKDVDREIER